MLLHNRESMLSVFGIRNGMIDVDRFGMFSFDGDDDQEKSYCYFWHIALRNIEPGNVPKPDAELGDRVHHIETSFNIEPTEQRDLFEAAAVLVKKGFEQAMGKGEGRGKEVKAILSKLAEGP